MRALRRVLLTIGMALVIGGLFSSLWQHPAPAAAQDEAPTPTPETPTRQVYLNVDYTLYTWWLMRWSTNHADCAIYIEHPGLPTSDEIYTACGAGLTSEWANTQPCPQAETGLNLDQCPGMYLHPVGETSERRKVVVDLPLPKVWVTLSDCNPVPPQDQCSSMPFLTLTGQEPLPNEAIIRIQGTLNGEPFSCPGDSCNIPLQPTGPQGETVVFWADSSYGDESQQFTAMVRVLPWGDFMAPEGNKDTQELWYVDVISSQWRGGKPASCADTWQVFPDIGGPPAWLITPDRVEDLQTDLSLHYLAGMLIQNGVVDSAGCPGEGQDSDFNGNACGIEAALPAIQEWQNKFDNEIMQVAHDTGVPAQLMKNMFSRESQLWPGIYTTYKEAGLGQLTENGADTVLLWNPSFFSQFCPLILDRAVCDLGFGNIKAGDQDALRGALVKKVNASCVDCPQGIDLTQANFSVGIFAQGLQANCEQVGRIIQNTTNMAPGRTSNYVDLWRFTLVNYNAGPGCLANAIQRSWALDGQLNWGNVSNNLEPVCKAAIDYVDDVSRVARLTPTPTPGFIIGTAETSESAVPAQEETATPEPSETPSGPITPAEATPTPTATPQGGLIPLFPGGSATPVNTPSS
jgi:hypothetical protein